MGSVNKLSTIKSVFLVPIYNNTSKIKIDFFIKPLNNQQNRTAKFIIQDINSNKIYVKYFQKTNEMSIKNIEDSLNTVNDISEKIDENKKDMIKLRNSIKLKILKMCYFMMKENRLILEIYFLIKHMN